jgi:hypothetical protein
MIRSCGSHDRFVYHPPPNLPSTNATAKPAIAVSPILLPPSSKASGIIDSANIRRIAPAANDIATDITNRLALERTAKPIAVDIVHIITAMHHNTRCTFCFFHLISYLQLKPNLLENLR